MNEAAPKAGVKEVEVAMNAKPRTVEDRADQASFAYAVGQGHSWQPTKKRLAALSKSTEETFA